MGVPAFYRWLREKYPRCIASVIEELPVSVYGDTHTHTHMYEGVDITAPNPNGMEFDNLYLDMNGIIHPCVHPEDVPAPTSEEEMFSAICTSLDRIVLAVRPRALLFMAIDGVAPRAKMNQQRSRRFKAAADMAEEAEVEEDLRAAIRARGGKEPPPRKPTFDHNVITPGTRFMDRLAVFLRYFVHHRQSSGAWAQFRVILSDASVPGEGEHKIMEFIRQQRAQPGYNPNIRHVLHGLDADLIMLGLATHEPHFTILREEITDPKSRRGRGPERCYICGKTGHKPEHCTATPSAAAAVAEPAAVVADSNTSVRSLITRKPQEFLHLSVVREYIEMEFGQLAPHLPFDFDLERVIDDFVFMCFFVGNDFLPHLPSMDIREGAIDLLMTFYKQMLPAMGGYMTHDGNVNLSRVDVLLSRVGAIEDQIFIRRRAREERDKRQEAENKLRQSAKAAAAKEAKQARHSAAVRDATSAARAALEQSVSGIRESREQAAPALSTHGAPGKRSRDQAAEADKPTAADASLDNRDAAAALRAALQRPRVARPAATDAEVVREDAGADEDATAHKRARVAENPPAGAAEAPQAASATAGNAQESQGPPAPIDGESNVGDVPVPLELSPGSNDAAHNGASATDQATLPAETVDAGEFDASLFDAPLGDDEVATAAATAEAALAGMLPGPVEPEPQEDLVEEEEEAEADGQGLLEEEVSAAVHSMLKDAVVEALLVRRTHEGVTDEIQLGAPGWKERYYAAKFGDEAANPDFRRRLCRAYTEGLVWVFRYYYQGVASWKWYFPFHYAPFASDLRNLDAFEPIEFDLGTPFRPLEQLMGVLPPRSAHALPPACAKLMTDESSPVHEFYPTKFKLDPNGKRFAWMWVVLLPFIDEKALTDAVASAAPTFTDEEKRRNEWGTELLFVHASSGIMSRVLPLLENLEPAAASGDGAAPGGADAGIAMLTGDFGDPNHKGIYGRVAAVETAGGKARGLRTFRIGDPYPSPWSPVLPDVKSLGNAMVALLPPPRRLHSCALLPGVLMPRKQLRFPDDDPTYRIPRLSRGFTIADLAQAAQDMGRGPHMSAYPRPGWPSAGGGPSLLGGTPSPVPGYAAAGGQMPVPGSFGGPGPRPTPYSLNPAQRALVESMGRPPAAAGPAPPRFAFNRGQAPPPHLAVPRAPAWGGAAPHAAPSPLEGWYSSGAPPGRGAPRAAPPASPAAPSGYAYPPPPPLAAPYGGRAAGFAAPPTAWQSAAYHGPAPAPQYGGADAGHSPYYASGFPPPTGPGPRPPAGSGWPAPRAPYGSAPPGPAANFYPNLARPQPGRPRPPPGW